MAKKIDLITDEEFIEIVKRNRYYRDISVECGYSMYSAGGKDEIVKRMKQLGLSQSDMKCAHKWRPKRTLDEILIENSPWLATPQKLKIRLINELGWKDKCSECGIEGEYNGKPITLQLDHINGNNKDNRLENLRILCPNCHSQTRTYGHKKR